MPTSPELPQEHLPTPEVVPQLVPTPEQKGPSPIEVIEGALEELNRREKDGGREWEKEPKPTLH